MNPYLDLTSPGRPRILTWYNVGSSECPANGLIQITDILSEDGDALIVQGDNPATGMTCVAVNLVDAVPVGKYGQCTIDFPAYAAYDTADGTPANDEEWGPESGSWKLKADKTGFKILGNPTNGIVAVQRVDGAVSRRYKVFRLVEDLGSSAVKYYEDLEGYPPSFSVGPNTVQAIPQRWADESEEVPSDLLPGIAGSNDPSPEAIGVTGIWVAENWDDFASTGPAATEDLHVSSAFYGFAFGNVVYGGASNGDPDPTAQDLSDDARGGNGWLVLGFQDEATGKWFATGTGAQTIFGTLENDLGSAGLGLVKIEEYDPVRGITPTYTRRFMASLPGPAESDDSVKCTWDPVGGNWVAVEASTGGLKDGCAIDVASDGTINWLAEDAVDPAGGIVVTEESCKKLRLNITCGLQIVDNELGIKNTEIAPDGSGLVTYGTCGVAVNPGCGIEISSNQVRVKASDLAAANGGLTTSGTCGLAINVGCGVEISGGALRVKNTDLAGTGLITSGTCGLAVSLTIGCGLTGAGSSVSFNRTAVIGDGLEAGGGTCDIKVKVSCGIEISGGAVRVKRADLIQASGGLETGSGTCDLKVKDGCGITLTADGVEFDADVVAGNGLSAAGCALNVDMATIPGFNDCVWWTWCNNEWVARATGPAADDVGEPPSPGDYEGQTVPVCECTSLLCPGTLVSEDFTGTNGDALNGMVPDIGPSAVVAASSFDIQSNRARQTGGTNVEEAVWESGEHDVVVGCTMRCTFFGGGGGPPESPHSFGLIGRYVDANNYWLATIDSGTATLLIQEVTAGVFTSRASVSTGTPGAQITIDTDYLMEFTFSGTSISVDFNGYSTSCTSSVHQTATKHGIFGYAPYAGVYSFEDFYVTC